MQNQLDYDTWTYQSVICPGFFTPSAPSIACDTSRMYHVVARRMDNVLHWTSSKSFDGPWKAMRPVNYYHGSAYPRFRTGGSPSLVSVRNEIRCYIWDDTGALVELYREGPSGLEHWASRTIFDAVGGAPAATVVGSFVYVMVRNV